LDEKPKAHHRGAGAGTANCAEVVPPFVESPDGPTKQGVKRVVDQAGEHRLQERLTRRNMHGIGELEYEQDFLFFE
jgi:hypothetical protein